MSFKHYSEEELLKRFGKRLKEFRKGLGYKNAFDFAYAKDLEPTQYAKWETGKNITLVSLMKILNAFEVTLENFFSEGFEGE